MESVGGEDSQNCPQVPPLRPPPSLPPEGLALIPFWGTLPSLVPLLPSAEHHEESEGAAREIYGGISEVTSLTLMTRYLGGSLAMRVKSPASSLKVGLMFSSIIQPRTDKKFLIYYIYVWLVSPVWLHSHLTITMYTSMVQMAGCESLSPFSSRLGTSWGCTDAYGSAPNDIISHTVTPVRKKFTTALKQTTYGYTQTNTRLTVTPNITLMGVSSE